MKGKERVEGSPDEESGYFSFGHYLRWLRIESGHNTIRSATEAIGISPGNLRRLESDDQDNPSLLVVAYMAEEYGVSVSEIGKQWAKFGKEEMIKRIKGLLSRVDFIQCQGEDLKTLHWRSLIVMQEFLESVAPKPLNNPQPEPNNL
jgi:transcriptional regulator with XRE-family HTH domain